MSRRLTVVAAIDGRYLTPLAAMLCSLACALPADTRVDLRLLTGGLTQRQRAWLDRAVRDCAVNLTEVTVDRSLCADLKVSQHVSIETYYRLLAPRYLPDVERALYLDSDLVVRRSVSDLYTKPFDGAHLLAVPHFSSKSAFFSAERGVPSYKAIGVLGSTRTFNAGVMMLNLERWRQTNAASAVFAYLRQYRDHVLWWDQDGLNAVLHADWRALPPAWNVMSHHAQEYLLHGVDCVVDPEAYAGAVEDPWIVHFASNQKPWMNGYDGPFLQYWEAALAMIAEPPFEP